MLRLGWMCLLSSLDLSGMFQCGRTAPHLILGCGVNLMSIMGFALGRGASTVRFGLQRRLFQVLRAMSCLAF